VNFEANDREEVREKYFDDAAWTQFGNRKLYRLNKDERFFDFRATRNGTASSTIPTIRIRKIRPES